MGAGWDRVLFLVTGIGKIKRGWVDAVLFLSIYWDAPIKCSNFYSN